MSSESDRELAAQLLGADRAVMARLAAPFQTKERPGKGGKKFQYVNSAMALNRLDDAVGPENWSHELTSQGWTIHCRVTITLPSGRAVSRCGMSAIVEQKPKQDADRTIADAHKEAASDAFKVACRYLGIARYLWYETGHPTYYKRFALQLSQLKQDIARQRASAEPPGEPQAASNDAHPDSGPDAAKGPPAIDNRPGVKLYQDLCYGPQGKEWSARLKRFGADQKPPFPDRVYQWDAKQCEDFRDAVEAGVI